MSVPEAPSVYEVDELADLLSGDHADTGDGEWYAIRTDPWPCPACGAVFEYVTGAHYVIVAPERDDLLQIAAKCQQVGRNPKIVSYDDVLPTMTLFQWHAQGRPVHGMRA